MDPVSLTASVIAIVQITTSIVGLCKRYIECLKDAPQDVRMILTEIWALKTVFENLEFLIKADCGVSKILEQLGHEDGPMKGCLRATSELEKLLTGDVGSTGEGKRRKIAVSLANLAWPLKEPKARKLLDEILRYKNTINLLLTSESTNDVKQIKHDVRSTKEHLSHAERQSVLEWLVSVDPSPNHNRACDLHEEHTGKWMVGLEQWQNWLDSTVRFIWIHGIPGAGKTVLASYLIEQAKAFCSKPSSNRRGWCYYYCYHGRNHDETTHLLRWVLNQLCRQADCIPEEVRRLYQLGADPTKDELMKALGATLQHFESVHLLVDALDESQNRGILLKALKQLLSDPRLQRVQLIVTSRKEVDIENTFTGISMAISMSNSQVDNDIRHYIHATLHSDPKYVRWPVKPLDEVEEALVKGAKGMFRWASCQLDILKRLKHEAAIRKAIGELPKTLDETYERILTSIPEESRLLSFQALSLLCCDSRNCPIETAEVLVGAVIFTSQQDQQQPDSELFDVEALREVCCCLISVSDEEEKDIGGAHSVVLAHYTVKEYLFSVRICHGPAAYFHLSDAVSKTLFPITVFSRIFNGANISDYRTDKDRQFLDFGNFCFWNSYYILAEMESDDFQNSIIVELVLRLLDPRENHFSTFVSTLCRFSHLYQPISWKRLPDVPLAAALANLMMLNLGDLAKSIWKASKGHPSIFTTKLSIDQFLDGTLLEISASLGLEFFLNWLVAEGAKCEGNSRILLLLLRTDIKALHEEGYYERKHPVEWEHPAKCLLDAGAVPNPTDTRITPLQAAIQSLDIEYVDRLLLAGADPNAVGNPAGKTPPGIDLEYWDASPLYICRRAKHWVDLQYYTPDYAPGCGLEGEEEEEEEEAEGGEEEWRRKKIEKTLLRYGARDFRGLVKERMLLKLILNE